MRKQRDVADATFTDGVLDVADATFTDGVLDVADSRFYGRPTICIEGFLELRSHGYILRSSPTKTSTPRALLSLFLIF